MDQIIFACLSHTHYWYEVGMLKVHAVYNLQGAPISCDISAGNRSCGILRTLGTDVFPDRLALKLPNVTPISGSSNTQAPTVAFASVPYAFNKSFTPRVLWSSSSIKRYSYSLRSASCALRVITPYNQPNPSLKSIPRFNDNSSNDAGLVSCI